MTHRLARFAGVYALAYLGAFLCFVPLIGLLLPQRMAALAGDDALRLLSWALLLGALVASVSNIMAGALSDRWFARCHTRRPLILLGLVMTFASFAGLALAHSALTLIAAFLAFQLCFNFMFAPLSALVTDYVADADKGKIFGVLSLALPLAQASIFAMVAMAIETMGAQLAIVAVAVGLCMVPLFSQTPPPLIAADLPDAPATPGLAWLSRDFMLAWFARLFVQCASVAMGSYIFVHLTTIVADDPSLGSAEQWLGRFAFLAAGAGVLTGLVLGIASDRAGRRRPFLWPTALTVGIGCAALTATRDPVAMAGGYALFAFGLAGFLTVDGAMVAQLVGSSSSRAAALGVMNLTNTLSGILVPAAALAIHATAPIPTTMLFAVSAAGAVIAAALVAMIRSID